MEIKDVEKVYIDKNNNLVLDGGGETHYISIPPDSEDRTDIITDMVDIAGYKFNFKGIIIKIRKGIYSAELII